MTEIIINHDTSFEIGFELTEQEATFLIKNGYQYKDRSYEGNHNYVPVAMSGLYGDLIINSIPKNKITKMEK